MAGIEENGLKSIRKIIQCRVCDQVFKRPITLPCGHSFCGDCVRGIQEADKKTGKDHECPVCTKSFKMDKLTSSYLVNQFLDHYHRCRDIGDKTCLICQEREANSRCIDCKLDMCDGCRRIHSRTPITQDHQFEASGGGARMNTTLDEALYCPKHKSQKLEIYCTDCKVVICSMCRNTSHAGHTCETCEEGNARLVPEVKALAHAMKYDLAKCQQEEEYLRNQTAHAEKQVNEVKAKYQLEKRRIIHALEEQEWAALEAIERQHDKNCWNIQKACDENKIQQQDKLTLIETIDIVLDHARGCSLLKLLNDEIIARLEEEKKKPSVALSLQTEAPLFTPNTDLTRDFVYLKPPGVFKDTQSFPPEVPAGMNPRHWSRSAGEVLSVAREKIGEVALNGRPERLGLVNGNIWIPRKMGSGCFDIYKTSSIALEPMTCEDLGNINAFWQSNQSEVIAACNNGLFALTTAGHVKYKISDGNFNDVCSDVDRLVAVQCNKDGFQLFKISNEKWVKNANVLKPLQDDAKSAESTLHVHNSVVYMCSCEKDESDEIRTKLYKYSLTDDALLKMSSKNKKPSSYFEPVHTFSRSRVFLSSSDCEESVIMCGREKDRRCIQVMSAKGQWKQQRLVGTSNVIDALLVKDRLYVLWGFPAAKMMIHKIHLVCDS